MIYLDNAATTRLDERVLQAMMPYMTEHYGNASSIHAMGRKSRAAVEKARRSIAQYLNASIGEIFFTSGGTESNNMALLGAACDLGVRHFITSPIEHHCVLHTLEAIEKSYGTQTHFVKICSKGHVDLTHLKNLLDEVGNQKTMVCLMHANNEIGTMMDMAAVSEICAEHGALLHSDTVQTFGYYKIDVQKTPIAFLTGSGHKLHGPKGAGFLYINSENTIQPLVRGGSQERNMRAGTENVYGIVGLGKAAELAYENLEAEREHLSSLKTHMAAQIKRLFPDVAFNGDYDGRSNCKVLNVAFRKAPETDMLLLKLDIAGICASGGSACSSGVDLGSHVIRALNAHTDERVHIRFSFSRYNTLTQVNEVLKKLAEIAKVNSGRAEM